ncbi:MAG: glyceraldehyde 3-phosphate dehydrogenase NAD-binding domain-containing protein [Mollicutes bacterium]|nr:MAG: glyceraldehyde 3-phosphate dehydrogenase NAD-binding domain-containing protein [Mollicutes bacterium]
MSKKPKILLVNFDRLEKLLMFNLLSDNSVEITGIISEHDPKVIAKFIEYDSNHGKFAFNKITVKNTKTEKRIMIQSKNPANIRIFSPKDLNKKMIQKYEIDLVVSLSPHDKKEDIVKLQKLKTKAVLILGNKHTVENKDFELTSFGINHKNIDLSKNQTFIVPPIESTIGYLLNERVAKNSQSAELYFQIVRGPEKHMNLLDSLEDTQKSSYFRSAINNIIPSQNKFIEVALERILRETKTLLTVSGDMVHIPVTTGALMTLVFQTKKIVKKSELSKLLKELTDDLIGYSMENLVSQDVVSTPHYGIVDETLLGCLNSKNLSVIKMGV